MSGVSAAHRPTTFAVGAKPATEAGAVANEGGMSFVDILSGQMAIDVAGLLGGVLDPKQADTDVSAGSGPLDPAFLASLGLTEGQTALPVSIPALANAAGVTALPREDLLPGGAPANGLAGATQALARGPGRQELSALSQGEGEAAAAPVGRSGKDSASAAAPTAILAADTASAKTEAKSAVAIRPSEVLAAPHDPNDAATMALQTAAAVAPAHAAAAQTGSSTAFRIVAPLGDHRWQDAIGDSLVLMTGQQQNRAELVLTPPQLGRVEVSLTMTGDQANALFVSANPAVREALESALPRLRELLADAGIVLNSQVGSELPRNADSGDARGELAGRPAPGDAASGKTLGLAVATGAAGVALTTSSGRGLVDVFA